MSVAQLHSPIRPTWCPGCGDYSVLAAVQKAIGMAGLELENTVVVSGIGCSGKLDQYAGTYGLHTLHGRVLPAAQGVKLANPRLTVIAAGGDGDGYGIGMGHFVHAMRRNVDITYVVMDNHIYGLTTGQASPTSDLGAKTKTSPTGTTEPPVVPLLLALSMNCGFVAQGFAGDVRQLSHLLVRAIRHRGFSYINVLSPCVSFNPVNTYEYYRERLFRLEDVEGYDAHDRTRAFEWLVDRGHLVTGIIYEDEERRAVPEGAIVDPLDDACLRIDEGAMDALLHSYR